MLQTRVYFAYSVNPPLSTSTPVHCLFLGQTLPSLRHKLLLTAQQTLPSFSHKLPLTMQQTLPWLRQTFFPSSSSTLSLRHARAARQMPARRQWQPSRRCRCGRTASYALTDQGYCGGQRGAGRGAGS